MDRQEICLMRLRNQHLLEKCDTRIAIRDLCGIQAQFLSHALHGLALRAQGDTEHLVKTWALRGTMHLIDEDDLALFLHVGRTCFLRPQDTMETDAWVNQARKMYFADLILDAIASGICSRENLKLLCRQWGMTEGEESSLFDPWGGIIRALCEEGRICHQVTQEKCYRLCPDFTPMDREAAHLELARRYFTHFGPATVKDAAYFLGWTQKKVKQQLSGLNVQSFTFSNRSFFYIPGGESGGDIPHCLFLPGFDQLMLGYEKKESLFLAADHMRQIFTLAGVVRPTILVDGTVAGCWNLKSGKMAITPFYPIEEASVQKAARNFWPELRKIEFV